MRTHKIGRPSIYPWDDWFEAEQFDLTRGIHYKCPQGVMQQQIRNAASKRGLRVSIDELDAGFVVTVIREPSQVS